MIIKQPASSQQLSPQARVSILTNEPGQELYSAFGHSAIRVYDPVTKTDRIYNYGCFSFEEPGFYVKFLQGKLQYWMAAYPMQYLKIEQKARQMTVKEQVLNLSPEQQRQLIHFLEINLQPENKYYYYDFFKDNCTTRIRDALLQVLGTPLDLTKTKTITDKITPRASLAPYLKDKPWIDLGINLVLGVSADRFLSPQEELFLPDRLSDALQHSTIARVPLIRREHILMKGNNPSNSDCRISPFWAFCGILVLYLLHLYFGTLYRLTDLVPETIILILLGLTGGVLLLLAAFSGHEVTHNNYNLLWLHPLHLLTAFLLIIPFSKRRLRVYALIQLSWCILVILSIAMLPQQIPAASTPLILLLTALYARIYISNSRKCHVSGNH